MNRRAKYMLFWGLVAALTVPAIQTTFQIIEEKPLDGAYNQAGKPQFSIHAWFSGEFQEQVNRAIEEHIGFRATFIRIRNQMEYWLYKKVNASNVVIGKDEVLFQNFYIDTYLGKDFLGDDVIEKKVEKLAFVQNELQKRNVFLVFVLAPGKASIYPEYMPSWVDTAKRNRTNYEAFSEQMNRQGIHLLDMRKYFLTLKSTSPYPLFPKCGTHWSGYSITLVADTLRKYIETVGGISLNKFYSEKGIETNENLRFTDNDIGKGMNLLWNIPSWNVYYPNIVFVRDSSKKKPNMLSIGDSFTQSFFGFYSFFSEMFNEQSRYWYYNKIISWPDSIEKQYISVETLDLKKEVEQRQVILMVSTEQNLKDFGFGFIENVYALYDPNRKLELEEKIASFVNKIKNDPAWIKNIDIKAKERGISLDSMIYLDARFLVEQEIEKISAYERRIKSDPNWLATVKQKASERNISVDKMIHLDAVWMVENENSGK